MKNVKFNLKAGLGMLVFLIAFSFTSNAQSVEEDPKQTELENAGLVKLQVTAKIKSPSIYHATPLQLLGASTTTNVSMKNGSNTNTVDFKKHAIDPNKVLIITEQNGKKTSNSN